MKVASLVRLSAIAAAGLTALGAHAQIIVKPDGEWRGLGGAAFSLVQGTTKNTSLFLNADAVRATARDKITIGANTAYVRTNDQGRTDVPINRLNAFGQYDWNLSPKLFAFGRAGLERDAVIDLNLRLSLLGGLGYKVIEAPALTFTVYGGAGYIIDRYDTQVTIGNRTNDGFNRATLYLAEESTHKLSETVSFKQRLDLFPGLSGDKAFIAKFNAGLAVAMSNTLSLNLGFLHNYNSKAQVGVKKGDSALYTGITAKFGS
jgi:putative salt-induced outer membrane protein